MIYFDNAATSLPKPPEVEQAVVQALEEGLPPEAALGTIQQATRRYAKRQMTWFRANPAVQWLDASAGADEIFRAALQKAADFDSGI